MTEDPGRRGGTDQIRAPRNRDPREAEVGPLVTSGPGYLRLWSAPASGTTPALRSSSPSHHRLAVVGLRGTVAEERRAGNAHTNAWALARVYGALACGGEVDGVRVLSPDSIERARAEQASGPEPGMP